LIGKHLKQLREAQGYTQESLAKISGVGEKYISAIEGGKREAGKITISKLCDALMVDELTLRFGERQPPHYPASPEHALLEQEVADLSLTEQLEVIVLLRKWKQERKQIGGE